MGFLTVILCPLPVRVMRAGAPWEIRIDHQKKGRFAELFAVRDADGKEFRIMHASTYRVREAMAGGLPSKPGTIRHDLFWEMHRRGLARMRVEGNLG